MSTAEQVLAIKGVAFVKSYLTTRVVRTESGCLEWKLRRNSKGYGKANFWLVDRVVTVRPHRLALLVHQGFLTPGLTVDHLCRNPSCIEPLHLEECTAGENIKRAPNRNTAKTHCLRGHPLVGENLDRSALPYRSCLACRKYRNAMRQSGSQK